MIDHTSYVATRRYAWADQGKTPGISSVRQQTAPRTACCSQLVSHPSTRLVFTYALSAALWSIRRTSAKSHTRRVHRLEQVFQGCPIDGCIRSRISPSEEQMTVLNLDMGPSLIGLVGRPTIHGIRRNTGTQGHPLGGGSVQARHKSTSRPRPSQATERERVTLGGEIGPSLYIFEDDGKKRCQFPDTPSSTTSTPSLPAS